jgi:hypothetical protein
MSKGPLALLANLSRLPEIYACYRETSQWLTVTLAYLGFAPLAISVPPNPAER